MVIIRTDRKKGQTLGFKARSLRGSTIVEEPSSDTSVTSETSAEEALLIRETSAATTVSTTDLSAPAFSSSDTTSKNPWQWHEMLKEAEIARRKMVAQKLAAVELQVKPLQQLVAQSLEETKKANRFVVGLAKAQEQLAKALILPEEEEDENEIEEEDNLRSTENSLSDVEDLPEKLRTEDDNGTTVCSVVEDPASIGDDPRPRPIQRRPSCNDGSAPPVFSIRIPNPNATEETVYVLHKQHDLLQQTMARSIPCVKNIEELKGSVVTKFVPFGPSEVVEKLKISENRLQLLWDSYCTAAKEVLAAQDATEVEAASAKYSMGDVWVAELSYRSAVARQAEEWQEYDETFPGVLDQVKDFEAQRRIKLHQCLQITIQKQALTFERAHQTHADALEDWVHTTEETTENANKKGDEIELEGKAKGDPAEPKKMSKRKKKRHKGGTSREKVVLSPKERIQQIADFAGATTYWDKPEKNEQEDKTLKTVPSWDLVRTGRKSIDIVGIDVDMYMDLSSDEDDLPLLQDAVKKKRNNKSQTRKTSKVDNGKVLKAPNKSEKRNSSKRDVSEKTKVKSKHREVKIHNNLIVLDQESSIANFMDRLLFSASLLESHYVVYSVVAGLAMDNDCLRASTVSHMPDNEAKKKETDTMAKLPRSALVIITCDLALHLFELPSSAVAGSKGGDENEESSAVPDLQPEDALRILLKHQEAEDRREKQRLEEQPLSTDKAPSSPTKMLLRLRRNKQSEEEPKTFQFRAFRPTASIALEEYNVRITRRGKYTVKLSSKNRSPLVSSECNRINLEVSSLEEQQVLVAAATRRNRSPQRASRDNSRVNPEFSFSGEQRNLVEATRGHPSPQSSSADSEVASF